ncbi:Nitrilotriacetate monooxygenase component A [Pigmentiphaga humi]|uniref:Nitrilotriacetate monooxygenase component A n=1 Tax=Pigmentiphaga humi TaxID=2478468 RepID=A0A3P4B1Z2_9BURK|nr:LLM class flavin-dependent oxidoreductase [Pigmentiphaga humi]VCU70309.1 Nitrilotriacetate monooxygenase component A [Pigmentiphaga humi]
MSARRQLSLNLFVYPAGHHEAAWRYPQTGLDTLQDLGYYQALAQRAEQATFDAIFLADSPVLPENIRYAARFRLEPLTWLSAIAAATSHIGLIGTATTTYTEPYNLARQFAALDHLSGGRAGWNIVTTHEGKSPLNFGLDAHPEHGDRYARATEFLDVAGKLWDSWEDDALLADRASGVFADTAKIHPIRHVGKYFRVGGALSTSRSPQGRPVYVQAGSSEEGRSFAARFAEAIFTAHQTLDGARQFYTDIKRRAVALGRSAEHIKVLPGISAFIGSTEVEARRLEEAFDELIQPEFSLAELSARLGVDFSRHDLDAPVAAELIDRQGKLASYSRFKLIVDIIDRERPTLRQLIRRLAGARGHFVLAGTPERIADEIQRWFEQGAADGFNVMPPWMPGGFELFADEVVPILRRRGLFRERYAHRTLRGHYGLPRPESQYAQARRQTA